MYASALSFAGLYTFPNPLANIPVGGALQADNLVSNKDGIAETRRGLPIIGTSLLVSNPPSIASFFSYQNHLIIHNALDDLLLYQPNLLFAWMAYPGNYVWPASPSNNPGYRIKGVEANKNFYLTTSLGVQKLVSYLGPPTLSGVPPGLDGTGVLAGAGSGFLGSNFQCAYQIVFGYVDSNGNLNLGSPSERILVVNATGGSDNVTLTFSVPLGLTTSYFYQIYRTPQTAYSATPSLNVPPGAEPQLSAQFNLTSGEISALSVTVTDVTTDAILGAFLYTNPSQQGALQNNDPPPFAYDMCVFSQMMFYANCYTLQTSQVNLISVGSPNGIQVGDTITVNSIVFTGAVSQNDASQEFLVVTGGTVAENIDATARNIIECVNANASTTNVYAIYLSGYNDLPGLIEFQAVNLSIGVFSVTSSRTSAFSSILPVSSSNDVTPNGIYVSKVGQPEAVPAVNLIFVGGGDQPIYRILALRDRVIVLKSDGVYVITGSTPQTLSITLLDSTIICIAPDSARLLNNSVYCLSQQGVVSVTESGVTIQSRAIESDILSAMNADEFSQSDVTAISYESEHLYILSLPTGTYCYNWITNAWTRWPMVLGSGIVNPTNNLLYLQDISRPNYVCQERKNYNYTDYMDDTFAVTITGVDATGLIVSTSGTPSSSWVGYGLSQTVAGNLYAAIITAVNAGSKTITVSLTNSSQPGTIIPWASTTAAVEVPIPVTLTYAPITGGFPHYMKSWTRANFWFNGGNFPQLGCAFTTDVQGITSNISAIETGGFGFGPYGPGPYGGNYNFPQKIQTLVPTDQAMAFWIMPTLTCSFPGARFSCLGVTASYDIVSDVSG